MNGKAINMDYGDTFNLRLLYVEDEEDTMKPMLRFLQRRFTKVIAAKNGSEGLKKYFEYHPDLIITDLLLPDFGGIDMLQKIREAGYSNPILITSALQDISSIVKTVDLGISKYIIKPVDLDELDVTLHRLGTEILSKYDRVLEIPAEGRKEHEANLKRELSNLLKKHSGKGPTDVKIHFRPDQIEIILLNPMTVYETTLLRSERNAGLVEHSRRLFYQMLRDEIEGNVSGEIGQMVFLKEITVDSGANTDVLHLAANRT